MNTNQSEINKIQSQFSSGSWPQFLESIDICGLRGWKGDTVTFKFPIVAIIGENGTGKSTLLKAAASAYERPNKKNTYYPSTFFPVTHWDKVEGVSIGYRVRQGSDVRTFKISKRAKRWSFPEKRLKREVFLLDIARTLPLDASAGYARIAKQAADEISSEDLSQESLKDFSHILGKDYSRARFAISDADRKKAVGVVHRDIGAVSQFHQGAGEDATLDLFKLVQGIPDYSLLIIDEIEASLHPRAQRRLISFLLQLCRQKKLQIILSTHSPYILEGLPTDARVLLLPGPQGNNVVYGVSTEFAMSKIDDSNHPELMVYVEDKAAKELLREIIVSKGDLSATETLSRIAISAVGPANVVKILGQLGCQGKLPQKTIAILDGDEEDAPGCIKLPGTEPPEIVVYTQLRAKEWPNLTKRFGVGAGTLLDVLEDAMRDPDHHKWNSIVGDRITKSASGVWETLCQEWALNCLSASDRDRIYSNILDHLS